MDRQERERQYRNYNRDHGRPALRPKVFLAPSWLRFIVITILFIIIMIGATH